jgi:hypothetical protein
MAYEGKRHKIDTCYFHHEKEDISIRNTEKQSDPITEIGHISRCSPKPPTTVEGTNVYSEKRNNMITNIKHVVVNVQEITTLSNEQTPII